MKASPRRFSGASNQRLMRLGLWPNLKSAFVFGWRSLKYHDTASLDRFQNQSNWGATAEKSFEIQDTLNDTLGRPWFFIFKTRSLVRAYGFLACVLLWSSSMLVSLESFRIICSYGSGNCGGNQQ